MPAGAGDLLAVQRGRRRVERLQRADRGDVDPLDALADHALAQVRGERLDLRQFGHAAATVPSRRGARPMKVVVAHNRYASAQPSGENAIVDARSRSSRAAGVEVLPFLRTSDEIADAAGRGRRRCCRSRRSTRRPAQRDLRGLLRRAPPGRGAPAQPVPAALALGGAHRARGRRAGGADRAQLPPGLRDGVLLPRRRASAPTAAAAAFALPGGRARAATAARGRRAR